MRIDDVPLRKHCGADWSEMTVESSSARVCAECSTVVHDLSSVMDEDARRDLASTGRCVRYLYDASGSVVSGPPPSGAVVIPAAALVSRSARRKWLAMASLAAIPLLLEACGPGDRPDPRSTTDASTDDDAQDDLEEDARAFLPADASLGDER